MPTPIPPPPGSAAPGELYVDLQSKMLWLGVSEAVSPDRAVLISNIDGVAEQDAETLAAANAYTDSRIATRAPTAHTHVAAQITDFAPAVEAVIAGSPSAGGFERGMVIMYHGPLTDIGVGPYAGWALCDGNNGTPNLRDKFVIGAGNKPPATQNSGNPLNITGGAHTHTVNPTTLTLEQLPSHNHGGSTGNDTPAHTHGVAIVTDAQGNHQHVGIFSDGSNSDGAEAGPWISTNASGHIGIQSSPASYTAAGGIHQHNVSGNTGAPNISHSHPIPAAGGGQGHTHTLVGGGGIHTHDVTPAAIREAIPYFALAYIMKL